MSDWKNPLKIDFNFHDKAPSNPDSAQDSHWSISPCPPPLATFRLATCYNTSKHTLRRLALTHNNVHYVTMAG